MKIKRFLTILVSLITITSCVLSLTACNDDGNKNDSGSVSGLTGTYTYEQVVLTTDNNGTVEDLRIYNDATNAKAEHLYCSVYPFNTVNGSRVSYTIEQRLKLKRDFTYNYQYSIKLTNMEQWGKDFAMISVQIIGEFTYVQDSLDDYTVTLANPTEGSYEIYGANVTGEGSIYAWNIKSFASYVVNITDELAINPDYSYNRYIIGRTLTVNKLEKTVADNVYYKDVMNDIAVYSDMSF